MNNKHSQRAGLVAVTAVLATALLGLPAASGQSVPSGGSTTPDVLGVATPQPTPLVRVGA